MPRAKAASPSPPPAPAAEDGAYPRNLIVFDNPDKQGDRPSGPGPWMPRWPFRLLLSGPPGSGKRNMLLNVVFRLSPPPSAVHIVHYDPETVEYDVLGDLGCPLYYYDPADFPTSENIATPEPPPIGETPDAGGSDDEAEPEPPDGAPNALGAAPLVIVDEVTADQLPADAKLRFERLLNFVSTHKNTTVMCSIQSVVNLPPKVRRGFNEFCL